MEDFELRDYKVFNMFKKQWALATAGKNGSFNTCTIAWGSLGSIWHGKDGAKPIVTVYINPDRYTHEFITGSEYFTVSFFPEQYREALDYLGTHSGRDGDKIAESGLTLITTDDYAVFEEANLTFICKKLYQAPFERSGMADEIDNGIYKNWTPHWMYIGEIIKADDRRSET